jgi:hypothetical protein
LKRDRPLIEAMGVDRFGHLWPQSLSRRIISVLGAIPQFFESGGTAAVLKSFSKRLNHNDRLNLRFVKKLSEIKRGRLTLTPSILVRIQVPQPNLSFRRVDPIALSDVRSGGHGFRKHVKRLTERENDFAILPRAVR